MGTGDKVANQKECPVKDILEVIRKVLELLDEMLKHCEKMHEKEE